MTAFAARRVEGSTTAGWCSTDLVHALAQLPEEVSLELAFEPTKRGEVELLSRAYGLEHRLELRDTEEQMRWRFEGASLAAADRAGPDDHARGSGRTMAELVDSLWPADVKSATPGGDDNCLSGHRIAVLNKTPSHYRLPLFNGLAERVARAGGSLRVFFLGANPSTQPWLSSEGPLLFDHEFLSTAELPAWVPLSAHLDRSRAPTRIPRALGQRMRAFGPSILLCGSFSFAGVAARAYATRRRVPFGLWNGETAAQSGKRSYPALRARQRRWLAQQADFGVAYGSVAARYLSSLAPGLPVVLGRNSSVVDVDERDGRVPGSVCELVTIADLSVPGKGLEVVVDALQLVKSERCRLRVVGNPPLPGSPLEMAAGRDPRIEFLGPLPHKEARAVLETSDVFVFPSVVDIFGLSLVEAMAAGLPSIASTVPGAVADLVCHGRNGLVASSTDPRSWADAIMALMESSDLRASLGAAAQMTIRRRWTMAHSVEGMMASFRLGALVAERGTR
jgi:glycosyltransferase involved in cell wall biosynthesis